MLAGFITLGSPLSARAVDVDWDNSSGDGVWTNPLNWVGDVVPQNGVQVDGDATFVNAAAGPATISATIPQPRDIKFGSDVGGARPGAGTVNQTGGDAILQGWFRMGISGGTGQYNLSGATSLLEAGRFNVGENGAANNTLTVTSGTLRQRDNDNSEPNWSRIGSDGTATFNVSGGMVSFHSRTMFAAGGNSVATVTQTGGTVETRVGDINIADTGTATYTISGGTLRKGGGGGDGFVVGQWTGSEANLNVSGTAAVISEARMIIGHGDPAAAANTAVGEVTQTGGTVTIADQLQLGQNVSGNGTYNLSGGVLDMTGAAIEIGAGTGAFNMTGGEIRNASSIEGAAGTFTQGGGRLSVGSNTAALGITTIAGNYTQTGPTPVVAINITSAGSDTLDVNGTATLTGTLDLEIAPGTTLTQGQVLTVLTADALSGLFSDAVVTFTEDGFTFTASYANNNVVLTVVPEPATAGLAVLGAAGLFLRRRRRSR